MFWRFSRKDELVSAGEAARRVHSAWLTRALRSRRPFPRIPTKPVEHGGFAELMATPEGPSVARGWWETALGSLDESGAELGDVPPVGGSLADGSLAGGSMNEY